MMPDFEMRHLARPVEFRSSQDGPGVLYGYAAAFNKYSQNLGGFVEQVDPNAFAKTLGDGLPVLCRYNHHDNYLLGTTEAGTLRLEVDDTGLGYEVDLPGTSAGSDVAVLAQRQDLRYSSFAFRTLDDDWSITEQGFPLRTLLSVQLVDVAPVNSPAYLDSTAGMRSLADRLDLELDTVLAAKTDELRSLILGEPVDIPAVEARAEEEHENDGQGETHPKISVLQRLLDLEKLK